MPDFAVPNFFEKLFRGLTTETILGLQQRKCISPIELELFRQTKHAIENQDSRILSGKFGNSGIREFLELRKLELRPFQKAGR